MLQSSDQSFAVRVLLVIVACIVCLLWLCVLFLFPESWQDNHGYNQLGWLVIVSLLHLVLGIALAIVSTFKYVSRRFALIVALAPVWHLAGSPFEMPWCIVIFVVPSAVILVAACFEFSNNRANDAAKSTADPTA